MNQDSDVNGDGIFWGLSTLGFMSGLSGSMYYALRKNKNRNNASDMQVGIRMGVKALGISTGMVVAVSTCIGYAFSRYYDINSV